MIIINKAILHILDFNSGVTVLSDQELSIENSVETFLLKHIEKSCQDQNAKLGKFYEDSVFRKKFNDYIRGEGVDFITFSRDVVDMLYFAIAKSDKLDSTDILISDLTMDGNRMLGIFKCNNRMGFIHQVVQTEIGIKNDIISHYAIMPGLTQRIDEYAFVDALTEEIRFADKKYSVEGESVSILPDLILECTVTASPKATMELVSTITKKVAENHGQSTVEAVTAAKSLIAQNLQDSEYLQPKELGERIFQSSPMMQAEYLNEIEQAGLADSVRIDQELALKKIKSHKLKTDTGIELNIPLDYFQNTDYVEFINHPNGTLSINLKNIMKLVNK